MLIEFLIFKFAIPLFFVGCAVYLLYAQYHPEIAAAKYRKYKDDEKAVSMQRMLYSKEFLIGFSLLLLPYVVDIVLTALRMFDVQITTSLKTSLSAINFTLTVVAIRYMYLAYKVKKAK